MSDIASEEDSAQPGRPGPSRLLSLLFIAGWIALAVAANVVLTLTPSAAKDSASTVLPPDPWAAAANRVVAQAFPGTGTDAIAYLVMDGRDPLGPADQQCFDAALNTLRADGAHVGSVLDWWSDPLTMPLGSSADERTGIAVVWLRGEVGTDKARESLDAARAALRKVPTSPGLRLRLTVPATTAGNPLPLTGWQAGGIAAAAALIAALLMLRAGASVKLAAMAVLTAALSLAVTWPLTSWLGETFSVTLAAVLTVGLIAAGAVMLLRRQALPTRALPGVCALALTAPLLFARTPAVHGVGLAALGVVAALGASLTLLPALVGLVGGPGVAPLDNAESSAPKPGRPVARSALAVALVLAICALPLIGTRWALTESAARPVSAKGSHFLASNRLPDVVLIKSDHDLRDPAGLIAIDAVSRRLMDIPGVRRVQSAAWPAGVPWADASLSSAAGRLSDQLDRQAATFVPQVTAIKTLATVLDQVSGSVNELESSVTAGVGGLTQMQQAINNLVAGTRNIKDTAGEVSGYLDPVRSWMAGVPDCAADLVCRNLRKAIDPIDRVFADVTVLSDGAARIAAGSSRTAGALTATPGAVAQMRSALNQLRSFVPTLETTIESTIPQVVQLSAFLKNLSVDFANTGEGGFYLPRKALADPSYQHVKQTMFGADGTATRLFVYSDQPGLDLGTAARAGQIESAAGNAMKYGSLADSDITVSGAAQVAAAVRAALRADAILLTATMLAVVLLISVWRGVGSGSLVGFALLGSWFAAVGITAAVCRYLQFRAFDASTLPASFAVLAACGVPYLITPMRRAVTPLAAVGGVFGVGVAVVSGGSASALGQIGIATVFGLLALTVVSRVVRQRS